MFKAENRVEWLATLCFLAFVGSIGSYIAYQGHKAKVKQPNRGEFQSLLSAYGGWYGIEWEKWNDEYKDYVVSVKAKHELDGETYEFIVSRTDDGVHLTVHGPSKRFLNVWQRDNNYRKKGENYPSEQGKALEILADQIWDAFCQGDTP